MAKQKSKVAAAAAAARYQTPVHLALCHSAASHVRTKAKKVSFRNVHTLHHRSTSATILSQMT